LNNVNLNLPSRLSGEGIYSQYWNNNIVSSGAVSKLASISESPSKQSASDLFLVKDQAQTGAIELLPVSWTPRLGVL
jgi:hypothetical protein